MKIPKEIRFEDYPHLIKYLYVASKMKFTVGSNQVEEAMEKHPEYFVEELERRRKWDSIPQEVHDDYWKEYSEKDEEHWKEFRGKYKKAGLMYLLNADNNERNQYSQDWNAYYSSWKPVEKELHVKYYSKYNIEYNGK